MEEGISILTSINLVAIISVLFLMFYTIIKKLRNPDGYPIENQINHTLAIIVLCGLCALTYFLDTDFMLGCVWVFNGFVWNSTRNNLIKQYNKLIQDYENQENIDLFNNKPSEFTRKEKSISDRLDEMLNEDDNE